MKYPVDLHQHTSYSPDAQYTPDELFCIAKEKGMHAIVATEHNVVRGIPDAIAASKKYGVKTVQGIEISTKHSKADVHVLGYSRAFNLALLHERTRATRKGYTERSRVIAEKINDAGIAKVDFTILEQQFKDSYVVKPQIAKVIAEQRGIEYAKALKFVERGGPGYVPYGDWAMTPHQAVDLIHQANGIAVLAHPGDFYTTRSSEEPMQARKTLHALVAELVLEYQLDGLEVYYSKHEPTWCKEFLKLAEQYSILITGGSDYHGPAFTPNIAMGDGGISIKQFENFYRQLPSV